MNFLQFRWFLEVAVLAVLSLIAFTCVFGLAGMLDLIRSATEGQISRSDIVELTLLGIPRLLVFLLPLSLALAFSIALGRWWAQGEIRAIHGCGYSSFSVRTPLWMTVFIAVFVQYWLTSSVVPQTQLRQDQLRSESESLAVLQSLDLGVTHALGGDDRWLLNAFGRDGSILKDVIIFRQVGLHSSTSEGLSQADPSSPFNPQEVSLQDLDLLVEFLQREAAEEKALENVLNTYEADADGDSDAPLSVSDEIRNQIAETIDYVKSSKPLPPTRDRLLEGLHNIFSLNQGDGVVVPFGLEIFMIPQMELRACPTFFSSDCEPKLQVAQGGEYLAFDSLGKLTSKSQFAELVIPITVKGQQGHTLKESFLWRVRLSILFPLLIIFAACISFYLTSYPPPGRTYHGLIRTLISMLIMTGVVVSGENVDDGVAEDWVRSGLALNDLAVAAKEEILVVFTLWFVYIFYRVYRREGRV